MKKRTKLSMVITGIVTLFVLVCGIVNVFATSINSGNSQIDTFVNYALSLADKGQLGSEIGLTGNWCGKFIAHVAKKTNLADAFPQNMNSAASPMENGYKQGAYTYYFFDDMNKDNIPNCIKADINTFEPRPGDIVTLRRLSSKSMTSSPEARWAHVGIVYNVSDTTISVVHGNWGSDGKVKKTNFKRKTVTAYSNPLYYCVACYTRPAYNNSIELGIAINEINFPDANFREYIKQFDLDGNGAFSQEERDEVISIDVSESSIQTLKGVEYFTALEQLECYGNQITELDVSKNTKLKYLGCILNQLTTIDLSKNVALTTLACNGNRITSIDVSKNTALTEIQVFCNQLTKLDISKNTALETLSCNDNQLTTLDLSNNLELWYVGCEQNQLSSLDVSKQLKLQQLNCDNNQLTELNVTKNTLLHTLWCRNNKLTSLNVSKNTNLNQLFCTDNLLTSLDVSNNAQLSMLLCDLNKLESLDICANKNLSYLHCQGNKLVTLDISNCPFLVDLYINNTPEDSFTYYDWYDESNHTGLVVGKEIEIIAEDKTTIKIDDTYFPDANFRKHIKQFDKDGSNTFSQEELNKVRFLYVSESNISTLQGIEYFPELLELACDSNQLTSLNVSNNTKLVYLSCDSNQLTSLNVNNNTELEQLYCNSNQLTSLNVSNNTKLVTLWCEDNQLTALDVSNNTKLAWLICSSNQLSALDVRNNTKLEYLYCGRNKLTALDVSRNTVLVALTCEENQLSVLDISKNSKMDHINCGYNNLTVLDISHNPEMNNIHCYKNQLTYLDASKNPKLEVLYCWQNELAWINVSKSIKLRQLWCSINRLTSLSLHNNTVLEDLDCCENLFTSLDVSKNTALKYLGCSDNQLTSLDISKNTALIGLECYGNKITKLDIHCCPALVKLVKETKPNEDGWSDENLNHWLNTGLDASKIITEGTETSEEKLKAYVTRCYEIIMGRQPDAGGLKTWYNELTSGRKTASEIIDRFVNSPEYLNKHYNYGDSVDILYQAMLGRTADAAGKANWVKKLESGQTLAHVINGFCFSKEFRGLCDSYGIRAGFVNIPNTDTTAEGKIKAFVQRCYRIILDREADPSGMQTWYEQLSSGKKAAAEIIDRFVNSPEFSGKRYSHSDSVEILYKAMLGRGSDAAGKANWVSKLDAGQPFAVVINGFCVSKEFTGICASYGIKPGNVNIRLSAQSEEELSMLALNAKAPITRRSETKPNRVEIINPSDTIDMNIGTAVQAVYINDEKAKEFIGRCYRVILGREASEAEVETWIGQMVNGTKTPDQIARGFLFSNEFKAKNVSSEELVRILYRVYMNREADPEGLKTWTEKLDNGTALNDLLNAFAKTNEFKKVISEMSK